MAFDANNEHTKALIKTLGAQKHLLDLPRDTLQAIAAQQGAEFVKMLADECHSYIHRSGPDRWDKGGCTLDWDTFISDVKFIAKLPTGPDRLFEAIMPFDGGLDWFMANMNVEDFKKHAVMMDDLLMFMVCQQYKQKAQQGVAWREEVWVASLKYTQVWFRDKLIPDGTGHGDHELWASLFERSMKLLSE